MSIIMCTYIKQRTLMPSKPCPPGKIINPATGRCVKSDGRIGKTLNKPHKDYIPPEILDLIASKVKNSTTAANMRLVDKRLSKHKDLEQIIDQARASTRDKLKNAFLSMVYYINTNLHYPYYSELTLITPNKPEKNISWGFKSPNSRKAVVSIDDQTYNMREIPNKAIDYIHKFKQAAKEASTLTLRVVQDITDPKTDNTYTITLKPLVHKRPTLKKSRIVSSPILNFLELDGSDCKKTRT